MHPVPPQLVTASPANIQIFLISISAPRVEELAQSPFEYEL